MQLLQLPLKKLNIDKEEFLRRLERIPEPERKKHSLELLATLYVVERTLEAFYGG